MTCAPCMQCPCAVHTLYNLTWQSWLGWDTTGRPPAALGPGLLYYRAVTGVICGLNKGSKSPLVEQTEGSGQEETQGGGRDETEEKVNRGSGRRQCMPRSPSPSTSGANFISNPSERALGCLVLWPHLPGGVRIFKEFKRIK